MFITLKSDDNGADIEVWSLKYLNEIINCTGHDRLNETKLCLKGIPSICVSLLLLLLLSCH